MPGSHDHQGANQAMVLGIIAMVCLVVALFCCVTIPGLVCAPVAWVKGAKAKNEIDANPGVYGNRGQAVAGDRHGRHRQHLRRPGHRGDHRLRDPGRQRLVPGLSRSPPTARSERAADEDRLVDQPDAVRRLDAVAHLAGQREQLLGASRRRGW